MPKPLRAALCFLAVLGLPSIHAAEATLATIIKKERLVEFSPQAAEWRDAVTNQPVRLRDRLRTREFSRAALLLADLDVLQVDELTTVEVLPAEAASGKARLNLRQGAVYFFHRNQPREIEIETPLAVAGVIGTEFHVSVAANGQTIFSVFDGKVSVANALGQITITNQEQALVAPGQPPVRMALIAAENILQWCLYYPGVVTINDFGLTGGEIAALAPVVDSYRRGHLLQALDRLTAAVVPDSAGVRSLRASLFLSVGQLDDVETQLATVPENHTAARALRLLIAAVKQHKVAASPAPTTASEALAQSYYFQSLAGESSLDNARRAAKEATEIDSEFGFAWVRLAELEFSFGRLPESLQALDRGLRLSPDNAQGYALRGFVFSAENRIQEALTMFDRALAIDPALANAWLGRGLCRIRVGQRKAGRADLEIAAALEPTRSVLRSYLGKAFTEINRDDLAQRELDLARRLDRNDPTPWLYSALLSRQMNRVNAAVAELEQSAALNENRRLYRSRYLLDQDRAVRSASLANIYQSAGLGIASVREASQSVNSDYANPSAHLFLAESYNALRDTKRINLRYETVWFNERLLANMLAPVGGGNLSQYISEQEYSRFFTRDGPGLSLATQYSSVGDSRTLASQFGTWKNTTWAFDVEYHHFDGYVPNSAFDRVEWFTQLKHQITRTDALFVLTKFQDFRAGDTLQYYDPKDARRGFDFSEQQRPILLAGYQHEWRPGVQTLFLGGRLENELRYENPGQGTFLLERTRTNVIGADRFRPFYDLEYRNRTENYTAELNQIFETEHHVFIAGGRVNRGHLETKNEIRNVAAYQPSVAAIFRAPSRDELKTDIERDSAYGYYTLKAGQIIIAAGVAYDRLCYPANFRLAPISDKETTADQVSPKAALVWTPVPALRLRATWTRSLGGITFDESIRLEPTQLAGFVQSYRTLISETVAGSVSAPEIETWGAGVDWNPRTGTYMGAQLDWLRQDVDRDIGVFNFQSTSNNPAGVEVAPGSTRERLEYEEPSITAYINQLFAEQWSAGAAYRFTRSELNTRRRELPESSLHAELDQRADYHELLLDLRWNHGSGWFWRLEGLWRHQQYESSEPLTTAENFWQANLFVGYRLRRQHGEVTLGILNLFDEDYRLQPLSPYLDLPRERAFYAAARFRF